MRFVYDIGHPQDAFSRATGASHPRHPKDGSVCPYSVAHSQQRFCPPSSLPIQSAPRSPHSSHFVAFSVPKSFPKFTSAIFFSPFFGERLSPLPDSFTLRVGRRFLPPSPHPTGLLPSWLPLHSLGLHRKRSPRREPKRYDRPTRSPIRTRGSSPFFFPLSTLGGRGFVPFLFAYPEFKGRLSILQPLVSREDSSSFRGYSPPVFSWQGSCHRWRDNPPCRQGSLSSAVKVPCRGKDRAKPLSTQPGVSRFFQIEQMFYFVRPRSQRRARIRVSHNP